MDEPTTVAPLPRRHSAGRGVANRLRVEIDVDEDELVGCGRPSQLRALRSPAHPRHPQFEQGA